MTDERMEMLLKESFVNIRPGAELQEKLLQTVCTGAGTYRQTAGEPVQSAQAGPDNSVCAGSVTGHRLCGHGNRKTLSCDGNHNRICEL